MRSDFRWLLLPAQFHVAIPAWPAPIAARPKVFRDLGGFAYVPAADPGPVPVPAPVYVLVLLIVEAVAFVVVVCLREVQLLCELAEVVILRARVVVLRSVTVAGVVLLRRRGRGRKEF